MEKSTKNVWESVEFKRLIDSGFSKVELALGLFLKDRREATEYQLSKYSPLLRRRLYKWAGKPTTTVRQIFRLLYDHIYSLGDYIPLNKITSADLMWFSKDPKKTSSSMPIISKEVNDERKRSIRKYRKTTVCAQNRKIRHCIPTDAQRSEDYVDGIKYRVIIYFGWKKR